MWSKISEEMASLAEERSEEDVVREELMSWMGQVPSVLKDVIPKKLVTHDVPSSLETESTEPKFMETRPGVYIKSASFHSESQTFQLSFLYINSYSF